MSKITKSPISRRDFFRASAAGAAAAGMLGAPLTALAQGGDFGPARKLIWVPQAAGDWEVPVQVGFLDFCRMVGWEYQHLGNPVYSVENHLEQLNNAIAAQPDVIATQLENVGLVSGFQTAIDNGITMVAVNQGLAEELAALGLNYIGANEYEAGRKNGWLAAQFAQSLTGRTDGIIVIGSGNPGAAAIDARQFGTEQGVVDYNEANGTSFTTEMFPDRGFDDAVESIQRYTAQIEQKGDTLVGLVGLGGPSGVVIYKTLEELGIAPGTYAAGSHDAFPDYFAGLEAGYVQWGIDQNLYLQGFLSAAGAWAQIERLHTYRSVDTSGLVVLQADVPTMRAREELILAKAAEYGIGAQ
jgi:ABC-type sugar transport system substrate-binding protein